VTQVEGLLAELDKKARLESATGRMMAEAMADTYQWSTPPEETVSGRAAALIRKLDANAARAAALQAVVTACGERFREYEASHRHKVGEIMCGLEAIDVRQQRSLDARAKAERNRKMAEMCERVVQP
jgi:hypothetical protein